MSSGARLYTSRWVLPGTGPAIPNGAVVVSGARITAVGARESLAATYVHLPVTDLGASVLMPGLVNAHSHLEYTALGPLAEERLFIEWLPELGRRAGQWTDETWEESARRGARLMLASGITSLGEIVTRGPAVRGMRECGLGGVAYVEFLGARRGDPEPDLVRARERLEEASRVAAGSRVHVGISPHSVYTLSGAALALLASQAEEENVPLSIHLAETEAEVDLVEHGTGPLADLLNAVGGHELIDEGGMFVGPVAYAHRYRLLARRTLAAHCTRATPEEVRLLRYYDASVALCPRSNRLLGAGEPPVAEMLMEPLRVGIGTDSLASNERFDLFEELRLLRDIYERQVAAGATAWARAGDPAACVRLLTVGGTEALGLQSEIGTLSPGKYADMVALSCGAGVSDPYAWVLEQASAEAVTHTWTSGDLRHAA